MWYNLGSWEVLVLWGDSCFVLLVWFILCFLVCYVYVCLFDWLDMVLVGKMLIMLFGLFEDLWVVVFECVVLELLYEVGVK